MNAVVQTPVEPSWLDWIAENRLRGCSTESMLQAMCQRGICAEAAAAAIQQIEQQPVFRTAERLAQRLAKLESVLGNLQRQWQYAPGYGQVQRRGEMTAEQFLHEHVIAQRPVVLTDLARGWPALQRWTPQWLAQQYGHVSVQVQAGRSRVPDYEERKLALRDEMPLAELVQRVLAPGAGNDTYLTANNQALQRPGLAPLLDDIGAMPPYLDRSQLPGAVMLWLGPAGTLTPLHHDTVMLMHTQIVGRKRWHLVSPLETPKLDNQRGVFSPIDLEHPDLARWPALAAVQVLDVTVQAGETLFLPLGWWHQVRALDVCISLSFTNLAWPNHFDYRNPEPRV